MVFVQTTEMQLYNKFIFTQACNGSPEQCVDCKNYKNIKYIIECYIKIGSLCISYIKEDQWLSPALIVWWWSLKRVWRTRFVNNIYFEWEKNGIKKESAHVFLLSFFSLLDIQKEIICASWHWIASEVILGIDFLPQLSDVLSSCSIAQMVKS